MEYSMVHMSIPLPEAEQLDAMPDRDKARALGEISSTADTFLQTVPALVASTGKSDGEIVSHGLAVHGQTAILSFLIRSE
jgi:hypothetical protein